MTIRCFLFKSLSLTALLSLMGLSGCREKLRDLTVNCPRNPSNLYRFTVGSKISKSKAIAGTFAPMLVIDGKQVPLKADAIKPNVYYADYPLGNNRKKARYYFELSYQSMSSSKSIRTYTYTTPLTEYVISEYGASMLQFERAPVGAEVRIIGSEFTANDRVVIGQCEVWTTFYSENAISFVVPHLVSGKAYPVYCIRERKTDFVGNLLIDAKQLMVQPSQLEISQGEQVALTVRLNGPVTDSLAINVTTNIPDSVIMPEVKIAAGEDSATISLEGGEPGDGKLYISAMGYEEVIVPIKVYAPMQ